MTDTIYLKGTKEMGFLILGVVLFFMGLPSVLWLFSIIEANGEGLPIWVFGLCFLISLPLLGYRRDYMFSPQGVFIYRCLWGKKVSQKIIAIGDIKKIFCSVTFNWKIDGGSRQAHNGAGFELIKKDHTREILTCIWFDFPEKSDEAVVFAGELSRVTGLVVEPDSYMKDYFVEEE